MKKNGRLVHVRVIKHLPQGLSVAVGGGETGIIRVREISWDGEELAKWKSNYPVGWEGYAFSIPSKKGEACEFSLRLVEKDPWDDFLQGFDRDKVYEGTVTGVFEYGAFIEIAPGISGLLHKTQIPASVQTPVLELFWYADKVFVTIREVDHEQRQIGLCLAPSENRAGTSPEEGKDKQSTYETSGRAQNIFDLPIPRRHILVIEDEQSQAEVVRGWLNEMGQSVDVVHTAEDALDFMSKTLPDIALIDIGLPAMNGAELARRILENYKQVQVVFATDWARANEVREDLDALQARGSKLLYKPLLPEDLGSYLLYEQEQHTTPILQEERLSLSNIPKLDAGRSLHSLLSAYRKHMGAEQAILFSLDPARRSIQVVERSGDSALNKNVVAQLIYSPVRDAAEDREVVVANEIAERDRKRFQYLLELYPTMVSCIGVPVPTQVSMKYALFALDRRAKQFSGERQMYAQGMALAIGAALDQNNLRERSALLQRSALIGNLASGMMHEINNLVNPLYYESNAMRKRLAQFEKDTSTSTSFINDHLGRIQDDVRRIINTARAFSRATAKGRDEILRVDDIVEETLLLLRDISERSNVITHFERPPEMLIARAPSAVLEQIILNVTLNAIQQIVEFRPGVRGWVNIHMEILDKTQDGERCRLLVEDNGPGIHTRLWEKVFEAGYSTRREGSGIGLYISRNLMRELGGEISISKSHIMSGTTFILEFPVHL